MSALADRIRALATRKPDLTRSEIARAVGCSPGTVTKALDPDRAREYARRDSARPERQAAKRREWNLPGGECPQCDAPMSRASLRSGARICSRCYDADRRARREERRRVISALWANGATSKTIAEELASTPAAVMQEVHRMRADGLDLPYRRRDVVALAREEKR